MKESQAADEFNRVSSSARKGLWFLLSSQFAFQIISWGLTVLTVRFIAPEDYGVMALAETILPYLVLLSSLDLASWIVQEKRFSEEDAQACLSLTVVIGIAITLVTLALSPLAADFYQNQELRNPLLILSATFLMRSLSALPDGIIRRDLRFQQLAAMGLVIGVTRGLLQLLLAYLGWRYWALVAGFLYRDVVTLVWLMLTTGLRLRFRWNTLLYKRALKFGLPSAGATILWVLYCTAPSVIVGRMFGPESLGFYAMAAYLIDLPLSKLNAALQPVLLVYFSKLTNDPDRLRDALWRIAQGVSLLCLPTIAGLCLVSQDLVDVALGTNWQMLGTAIVWMSVTGFARSFTATISAFSLAIGRPDNEFKSNIFGVAILPALALVFAYYFGMKGIYMSWCLFCPLSVAFSLFLLQKTGKISAMDFLRAHKIAICATVLMSVVVLCFKFAIFELGLCDYIGGPVRLSLSILIGSLTYLGSLWYVFGANIWNILFSFGIRDDETRVA